jgi:hypothetical protein
VFRVFFTSCLSFVLAFALAFAPAFSAFPGELAALRELKVEPARGFLLGPDARQLLLVTGVLAGVPAELPAGVPGDGAGKNRLIDLTRESTYISASPDVVKVSPEGLITPSSDGVTAVRIAARGLETTVEVTVEGARRPRRFHFPNEIVPVLSKLGCNGGMCHGKAEGQNGFKLSVFGFDPGADYDAIVKEGRGRRVVLGAPQHSLLLRKPLQLLPHGGGKRLREGSREHATLLEWIEAGAPFGRADEPVVERIEVLPAERVLPFKAEQQLQVTAVLADGSRRDVTAVAKYASNVPPIASVTEDGLVQAHDIPGQVAVSVAYLDQVAVALMILPQKLERFERPPEKSFIDGLVWKKLEELGIPPSKPASDEEFLRRVFLDVIGTLPAPEEARRFLTDERPDKRARLVDELLERPEYADFWALKWADILRVDRQALKAKGAYAFYQWLKESIQKNQPYDAFVREILTAQGSSARFGPSNFYLALGTSEQVSSTVSQLFLGVRIECAKCHHHPFDRWGQDDFYAMAGFFGRVERRGEGEGADIRVGPPAEVKNPRSGRVVAPHPLGEAGPLGEPGPAPASAGSLEDPRDRLAGWMTSPKNRWFSRAISNRVWAHFLGRGLIEPVDDLRETNPASNGPLLAALARYLAEEKFNLKQLIRAITGSQVYQLSSAPEPGNEKEDQNFSHATLKPLAAEVLLDAVCQVTGRPEEFPLQPEGTRAIELWDNRLSHYFLQVFGRPLRATACECERINEPSVAQVLHLMNSPEIQSKISHHRGRVRHLMRGKRSSAEVAEELYLACYARLPRAKEREVAVAYLDEAPAAERVQAAEDLLWALMNTTEFLFNH